MATLAITLLIAGFLQRLFHSEIIGRFIEPEQTYFTLYPRTALVFKTVISIYPIVVVVALIKVLKHWYEQDRKHQNLQKEKVEAELKFLKSQINPHFLFNTLNSLYALTLKKSAQASEVVLKISQLLNYLLYESNKKMVPLEKEIALIETYISLEKIRIGDRLNLTYRVQGDPTSLNVPPLLILPLIENSFKHGANNVLEEVWVDIEITIKDSSLYLKVQNSKDPLTLTEAETHGGIGLQNLKRRLELIYGEKNYFMNHIDKGDSFSVELKIITEKKGALSKDNFVKKDPKVPSESPTLLKYSEK
ncbi:sensor histidine kinase [Aquiflexum sp.]|uniref:sensor histidine kinase n=1 Tax=Aquiflexum sp. TaxID=1872584 RepID=UPI0035945716